MLPENFDEFVVFSIRAANEVLRQAAGGSCQDGSALKEGLEFEAELNGMSDAEIFARASAIARALADMAQPEHARRPGSPVSVEDRARRNDSVDALLRPYARLHGPLPAVLLDGAARHLAAER